MSNEDKINQLYEPQQERFRSFIREASVNGFNLRITDGYRSYAEQNALEAKGRTAPGAIVTNAKGGESWHNFGLAIDVVDVIRGYNIDWQKLGGIAKRVGLEWGGDWSSFPDKPHFQYTGGLTLEQARAGERPGENNQPINKKRMIRLLQNHRLVWKKDKGDKTAEYWVIRDNEDKRKKDPNFPKETKHRVRNFKSDIATLFGGYNLLDRKEWGYLNGLTTGEEFDLNNEAITHPELFEAI